MRKALALILTLLLGTAIYWNLSHVQNQPQKQNYVMKFSVGSTVTDTNGVPAAETPLSITITKWNPNYDKTRYEVFFAVTTTSETVTMLDNLSGKFFTGGWYSLAAENAVLSHHHVASLPTQPGQSSWLNISGAAPGHEQVVTAVTATSVPPSEWRIVVFALSRQNDNVQVVWTQVVSPSH